MVNQQQLWNIWVKILNHSMLFVLEMESPGAAELLAGELRRFQHIAAIVKSTGSREV